MRTLLVVLAIAAAAKIYAEDQIYRRSVSEALIAAHRSGAIAACVNSSVRQSGATSRAGPHLWGKPSAVTIAIGDDDIDVAIWDIDHPNWRARFRNPVLVLDAADRYAAQQCRYDIATAMVRVVER